MDFLEYLGSFKLFVGTYITFLKGYDADFPKNFTLSRNFGFKKKNLVEGRCVREVPRGFGPWFFLVPPLLVK